MYEIMVEGNFNDDENLLGGSYLMYHNGMGRLTDFPCELSHLHLNVLLALLDSFEAQNWAQARDFFKSVIDHSEDQVSRMYLKRCTAMLENEMKLDPKWNGLWDETFAPAITELYQVREFAEPATPKIVKEKVPAPSTPMKLT
jgi:hypothetical protein